jgi:hypothetical protein
VAENEAVCERDEVINGQREVSEWDDQRREDERLRQGRRTR